MCRRWSRLDCQGGLRRNPSGLAWWVRLGWPGGRGRKNRTNPPWVAMSMRWRWLDCQRTLRTNPPGLASWVVRAGGPSVARGYMGWRAKWLRGLREMAVTTIRGFSLLAIQISRSAGGSTSRNTGLDTLAIPDRPRRRGMCLFFRPIFCMLASPCGPADRRGQFPKGSGASTPCSAALLHAGPLRRRVLAGVPCVRLLTFQIAD